MIVHIWHMSHKNPMRNNSFFCIPTILRLQVLSLYLEITPLVPLAKAQQLLDQMEEVVRRQVLNRPHLLPTSSNVEHNLKCCCGGCHIKWSSTLPVPVCSTIFIYFLCPAPIPGASLFSDLARDTRAASCWHVVLLCLDVTSLLQLTG